MSWLPKRSTLREAVAKASFTTKLGQQLRQHVLEEMPWFQEKSVARGEMDSLRAILQDWLKKNMLGENMQAQQAVMELEDQLKPYLEQSVKENPSLEETLNTRFPTVMEKQRQSQEGMASPELLEGLEMPMEMVPKRQMATLASEIVKLADNADKAGLSEEVDSLSNLLPSLGLLKIAQYEGPQHYWIMNGRAFEKSWREKRKKKHTDDSSYHGDDPEFYRSAHDCWWETLEEYQESLLGDHKEWLKRYAGKKKETEEGSGISPSTTMSREMQKKHREMEEEGETPGEGIVNWLDEQSKRASGLVLMEKIASSMENGSSPGVAFYESMDQMISGKYLDDVIGNMSKAVVGVKSAAKAKGNKELSGQADDVLVSLAQIGDWMKNLWTGTKGYTGWGGGEGDRWRTGPLVALVQQMRKAHPAVKEFLKDIRNTGTSVNVFERNLKPILDPYHKFLEESEKRGQKLPFPPLFVPRGEGNEVSPEMVKQFIGNFDQIMPEIGEGLATAIQQRWEGKRPKAKAKPGTDKAKGPTPEQIEEALKTPQKATTPSEAPSALELPQQMAPGVATPEEAAGAMDVAGLERENAKLKADREKLLNQIRELRKMLAPQQARTGPTALAPV